MTQGNDKEQPPQANPKGRFERWLSMVEAHAALRRSREQAPSSETYEVEEELPQ